MKRPDDYAPANPEASEGINYVRSFGAPAQKEQPMNPSLDLILAWPLIVFSVWCEVLGIPPAPILRACADVVEGK